MNEIDHRCIKIGRQVLQTCRHRPMEIGAIWEAAKRLGSYLVGSRSVFLKKNKLQYNVPTNQTTRFKQIVVLPTYVVETQITHFHRPIISFLAPAD